MAQAGNNNDHVNERILVTRIIETSTDELGHFEDKQTLEKWMMPPESPNQISGSTTTATTSLKKAAEYLRMFIIPVAFPTETVYGLGADASNSGAVQGIFKAKGRPSDNPLIVHVCDLRMLREIISPGYIDKVSLGLSLLDPIPKIYKALIKRFWPGPLTIILQNPSNSKLAPEVTAGLSTFGARMPDSPLALSLIALTGKPLAAPSANASTKPSPTTASHVLQDLGGKIELIVSGGACKIGLESTVVDGLCHPPVVLRPGGVSIDDIRECAGWADVRKAYQDYSEVDSIAPRAPGMKYKHYSPKAQVILYEPNALRITSIQHDYWHNVLLPEETQWQMSQVLQNINNPSFPLNPVKIGIVRTIGWLPWGGLNDSILDSSYPTIIGKIFNIRVIETTLKNHVLRHAELSLWEKRKPDDEPFHESSKMICKVAEVFEITLGADTREIAQGLFAALRDIDRQEVRVIFVEGIEDNDGIAAAVMNRLRKAASIIK